jgi:hypothetical protein
VVEWLPSKQLVASSSLVPRLSKGKAVRSMVRAILKRGRVYPLDPLPENWAEGCALVVECGEPTGPAEGLDHWLEELNALGDPFEEPGEWERFQANLAEGDRMAKECVREQMDRP